jgi:hypothetical protein
MAKKVKIQVGSSESDDYTDVYNIFVKLAEDGSLPIPLNESEKEKVQDGRYPNPIDDFIIRLFDLKLSSDDQESWRSLNKLVRDKNLSKQGVDWLYGPHALTLIKAKMAKRGMKL